MTPDEICEHNDMMMSQAGIYHHDALIFLRSSMVGVIVKVHMLGGTFDTKRYCIVETYRGKDDGKSQSKFYVVYTDDQFDGRYVMASAIRLPFGTFEEALVYALAPNHNKSIMLMVDNDKGCVLDLSAGYKNCTSSDDEVLPAVVGITLDK